MKASPPKYSRALLAKIAFIALGILSAPQSRAVEIIGNPIAANLANGASINPGEPRAAGFTMPGQDYTLTDVVLRLSFYSGPSDAVISIYSDSSGFPGSSLATLVDPAAGGSPADYTFTPPAGPPTTLFANTSYWLVVDAEPGGNYVWISTVGAPDGVATFDGYAQNNGSTWANFHIPITGQLRFAVNGELVTPSVPETGSTAIFLEWGC